MENNLIEKYVLLRREHDKIEKRLKEQKMRKQEK